MGKAKRFNNYDSDVEQQRKLVKSYGLARQNNSASTFRSMPQSAPTATNTDNENVVIGSTGVSNNSITFAKIQDIATMKVIGRTATGSGDSSEISILDEDNMASDSAVALATQQSIKAYVDANGGSTSFSGFTADATLDMGDYNIEDVNVLKINSGSANSADSFTMYGTSSAGTINLIDDTDSFIIAVDGTSRLSISDTLVTSSVPISATGIQNLGHVYLNGAGTNDLLIDGTADGLEYKVPSGDEHQFFVNSVERMVISSTHTEIQNYIDIRNPTTTSPTNTAYSGVAGWIKIKVDGGDYRIPVWNAP
jgi:hypothetical protein